ncbi:MAG: hypothetical protein ACRDBG_06950, partial [Waterburya sp.]
MFFVKQLSKNKLLILVCSLILTIVTSNLVNSKTLNTVQENSVTTEKSTTVTVSQVFEDINFSNDYYSKMSEADRFYKQGDLQTAKQIQQHLKPNFPPAATLPSPQADLSQLDAKGQQYWTTANQGIKADPPEEEEITSQIFDPLESLVKEYPNFVPGHLLLADTYDLYGEEDNALSAIEKASEMYPGRDDILDARIKLLLTYGQPLEASIAAREFAYSYPNFHKTPAYKKAADEYFKQYQKNLKSKITTSGILGGIGQVATGNESAGLEIGQMLLAGEAGAGESFAQSIKSESQMVDNATQLKYIDNIGQKLAKLMG